MGLIRWFNKNWANTLEPTHPDLAPLIVPFDADAARQLVQETVALTRNWKVEGRPGPLELRLTRRTMLMKFVDDVVVTFKADAPGTVIHASSRSRIGKGDLGQNRRNILELWRAIRRRLSHKI